MTKEKREELLRWAAESKPVESWGAGYKWAEIFEIYAVLRNNGHSASTAISALVSKGVVRQADADTAYFACYQRWVRRVNRVKRQQAVPA